MAYYAELRALGSGLDRPRHDRQHGGRGGGADQFHVEAEFLIIAPIPAALCALLIGGEPHGFARGAGEVVGLACGGRALG